MSVLQDLAARLRTSAEQLPVDVVIAAADRLVVAGELLAWVRQTSQQPIGVPQLVAAVERLENATRALRAAQDSVQAYIAALGLATAPIDPATGEVRRQIVVPEEKPAGLPEAEPVAPLRRWWTERVDELTGAEPTAPTDGTERPDADPVRLLRRVAARVRGEDRSGLRADLRVADPPTGLALSAVCPAVLRRLSTDLLGRQAGPDDLRRLQELTESRVRQLLPGLAPSVPRTLLARVCRVPMDQREAERREAERREAERREAERREAGPQAGGRDPNRDPIRGAEPGVEHPADSAITSAVLVGILLHSLGRDPDAVDRKLTEPEPADA